MSSALDPEGEASVDRRPDVVLARRKLGERRRDVDLGERPRGAADRRLLRRDARRKVVEDRKLDLERALRGACDLLFELAKLGRGEAHGACHRLPMDEFLGAGACLERLRLAGGDLDEIAEHVVVPDLERADAALLRVARLQPGDDAPALVAKRARFVERRVVARAHEAAVALQKRKVVGERRFQRFGERRQLRADVGEVIARTGRRNVGAPTFALIVLQLPVYGVGCLKASADHVEIARSAALEPEPRQGAKHVRHAGKRLADFRAKRRAIEEELNRLQAAPRSAPGR